MAAHTGVGWRGTLRTRLVAAAAFAALSISLLAVPVLGQPLRYGHTWGTPEFEAATAIEIDAAGNVYLAGILYDPDGASSKGFVAKLDASGNLVWDRTIAVGKSAYIYDMAREPSGRLFLLGTRVEVFSPFIGPAFVIGMTTEGEVLFAEDLPAMTFPARIATDPANGGFVLAGINSTLPVGFVASFDARGSLRWARSIAGNGTIPYGVAVDGSGTVHVLLARNWQDVGIASFTDAGFLLRQGILTTSPYSAAPRDLALSPDGSLLAMASIHNPFTYDSDLLVLRVNETLDMIWQETVGTASPQDAANRIVAMPDGGMFLVGPSYTIEFRLQNLLIHLDREGAFLEASAMVADQFLGPQVLDAVPLADGSLAIAGTTIAAPSPPSPISDVSVRSLDLTWSDDAVRWETAIFPAPPVEVVIADPAASVDDYGLAKAFQAWYAVLDGPAPPVDVIVSYVQDGPTDATVDFAAAVAGGTPPYTYRWSFGDGTFSDAENPAHVYDRPGRYWVQLRVQDASRSAGYGFAQVLIAGPPEVIFLQYYPVPAEAGEYTYFTALAVDADGGSIVQYRWDFGDGISQITRDPYAQHVYALPGTYTLVVTATDDEGDTGSASLTFDVLEAMNDPPLACFYYEPFNPRVGTPVRFSGFCSYDPDGYVVSWSWDFGDGAKGAGPEVVHAYAATGTYLVTLTVADDMGATSQTFASIQVVENIPPVASFWFSPQNPATQETVYFNAYGSYDPDGYIVAWNWDFGEGVNTTGFGPEAWHAFSTGGDHLVTLTVVDNAGASSSASAIVHVNERPVPVITTSTPAAKVGTPITFDGTASYDVDGNVASYFWYFGDGASAEGPVARHVYGASGAYNVHLTVVDDLGAAATTTAAIAVLEPKPPVAIIAWSPSRPGVGQEVVFDGTNSLDPDGSIATYIWQFGDGSVAHGLMATHTYANTGTYEVKLTVIDEDGLVDDDIATVLIVSRPKAEFRHSPESPAARQVVTFFAAGSYDEAGIVAYRWSFGDGTYGTGWQVSHVYASAGTYAVTLEVTNAYGATATTTREVRVTAPPAGRVVSSAMEPIGGARVSFYREDALVYETYTQADGTFEFAGLPVGTYTLEIVKGGFTTIRSTFAWTGESSDAGTWILRPSEDGPQPFALPPEVLGGVAALAALGLGLYVRRRRRTRSRAAVPRS